MASQSVYLPVETLIKAQQDEYYNVLGEVDKLVEATPFIGFMLSVLHEALAEADSNAPKNIPASDPVKHLLTVLTDQSTLTVSEFMQALALKHKPTFRTTNTSRWVICLSSPQRWFFLGRVRLTTVS